MGPKRDVVLAALAGVVGLVLTVVGGVLADEFSLVADDASAIREFFAEAAFDAPYVSGVILETVGFLLVMVFLLAFAHTAAGGTGQERWLRGVVGSSVIVGTALTLVSVALHAAGTFRASNGGFGGDGYVLLVDVALAAYWVSLPAWALALASGGFLILRRKSFPLWLGWAALVIAAANVVVAFFDSVEVWDAATGLAGLWWLTTAVYMLMKSDRYSIPSPEGRHPTQPQLN